MLITANIFQPLMTVFDSVIKAFHSIGIPWGGGIVLLTVCIRAILVPLAIKQYRSMRALQGIQPKMKEVQQKYKQDKQRQQQEMMKLYKEHNVNPFASCLPMVIQLPVLISLYYMLRTSLRGNICPAVQRAFRQHYATVHHISLKAAAGQTTACATHGSSHGASFLFINDLTAKATGATLIVLIVLYIGTMVLSTMMMSTPTMDKTQQRMMMLLPLVFVVFVISFPSGVIVYWITTNLWTIAQQYLIRRRLPPPAAAAVLTAKATAGGGVRGAPERALTARGGGTAGGKSSNGFGADGTAARGEAAPAGGGSGIVGALRKRKEASEEKVAAAPRARAAPPPPPRKKKKRSGRRR
jgi:YidC/Oxa1 family membrane protein insertase